MMEPEIDFYAEVERYEIALIMRALAQSHGIQRRAARLLRMKTTTLNTKIKRYGIDVTTLAQPVRIDAEGEIQGTESRQVC